STPARAAAVRSPAPASHARSTSQISVTATSRNPIPRTPKSIDLKAPGTGSDQDPKGGAPGGPITGNRVVPCSWQKTPKGGPMLVAGDTPAAPDPPNADDRPAGWCLGAHRSGIPALSGRLRPHGWRL